MKEEDIIYLASAGYDHTIRFWSPHEGKCSRVIQHPHSQVNDLKITPDKTFLAAARYQQQNGIYGSSGSSSFFSSSSSSQQGIAFQSGQQGGQMAYGGGNGQSGLPPQSMSTTPPPTSSSSDYYTGLEYGVCKDVSPGQEIDFLISDPCYKKSIAECEPFYFVIREMSQPGEGDPNYMCRDEGCKRFDQAKFVMTHTGVSCSSALRGVQASWFLIMISTLAASILSLSNYYHYYSPSSSSSSSSSGNSRKLTETETTTNTKTNTTLAKRPTTGTKSYLVRNVLRCLPLALITLYLTITQQVVRAQQQAGVYDFGQNRYGERRGNFTPSEVTAIILIIMLILGGLALTISLCYYITKKSRAGMQPVAQDGY